ncbi:MAG TPA: hypothetical protein VG713_21730, partial [Pirellulales bacterium]|nr:hypothetical protein [Pirellulales bacterium]
LHNGLCRNFYCDFFARYLGVANEWELQQAPHTLVNEETVELLSNAIPAHFQQVFGSLQEAYGFLEQEYAITIQDKNRFRNAVWRPANIDLQALREALEPFFTHDYALLAKLRRRGVLRAPSSTT